jgi:hypothetical protein
MGSGFPGMHQAFMSDKQITDLYMRVSDTLITRWRSSCFTAAKN